MKETIERKILELESQLSILKELLNGSSLATINVLNERVLLHEKGHRRVRTLYESVRKCAKVCGARLSLVRLRRA